MNMSAYEILRLVVWVIGLPVIVYLLVRMIRQIRDIHTLDTQLREEEERNKSNPYYQMNRLYEAQALLEQEKQKKKGAR